jgi:hypothetical protein
MIKYGALLIVSLFLLFGSVFCQDDFLKVECTVSPMWFCKAENVY